MKRHSIVTIALSAAADGSATRLGRAGPWIAVRS